MPATTKTRTRKILDPVKRGLLPVEDIRAAVRAVAAEGAKARWKKEEMPASGKVARGATPDYDTAMQRLILSPLEIGSRTPEEFRAAVRATSAARALRAKKNTAKGPAVKKQATKKTLPKTL
jgi:hypothetical protein